MSKESKKISNTESLTGHFLIAMPGLDDGLFNHSVTYICEHNENGCFGVVINNETDITLQRINQEMNIVGSSPAAEKKHVFIGGPVDTGRGFVLHSPVGQWKSSLKVNESIALTTSKDILQALADGEGPEQSIITLGYAGWSAGQLENELAHNAWLNCPADDQIIFNTPASELWQKAAELIGIDMQLISQQPGHA